MLGRHDGLTKTAEGQLRKSFDKIGRACLLATLPEEYVTARNAVLSGKWVDHSPCAAMDYLFPIIFKNQRHAYAYGTTTSVTGVCDNHGPITNYHLTIRHSVSVSLARTGTIFPLAFDPSVSAQEHAAAHVAVDFAPLQEFEVAKLLVCAKGKNMSMHMPLFTYISLFFIAIVFVTCIVGNSSVTLV
jgi:hypothetical protein